jgi:hypothetical protein
MTACSRSRAALWVLGLGLLSVGSEAEARVYPIPLLISNEDDLRNHYEDGLISEEEFAVLIELLNNPLDLNSASRGELFDLPGVTMRAAREIVAERRRAPFTTISELQERIEGIDAVVVEDIEAFVIASAPDERQGFDVDQIGGRVYLRTGMYLDDFPPLEDDHPNKTHKPEQLGYPNLPGTQLTVDMKYGRDYGAGAVMLFQPDVKGVVYDPADRDFDASYGMQGHVGRVFAWAEKDKVSGILGHYTVGFGQGLTFDRTNRTQPNGWYKDISVSADELFRRFRLTRAMFGGAGTHRAELGGVVLETTAFASMDDYDLYQYDMGMTGGDTVDWSVTETDSPRVYLDGQKLGWATLPNAYRETIGGVSVNLETSERSNIGLTSYVAHQDRTTIEGIENPNEYVIRGGYPINQDTYGAVGVNGSYGVGIVDFFGEGAMTYTGGGAVLLKALVNPLGSEIELSLRHYGTGYDNPYARGIAQADQYLGYRDRDEQGARVKGFVDMAEKLRFQGIVDYWRNISLTTANLYTYGRLQYRPLENRLALSLYGYRTDQNLSASGRNRRYGGDADQLYEDQAEERGTYDLSDATERSGTRNVAGLQVQGMPADSVTLTALYQRMYTDSLLLYPTEEGPCDYWYQIGHYGWFKVRYQPIDATWLTLRVRYRDEDVYGSRGLHELDTYLQLDQKIGPKVKLVTRGLMGWKLPDPEASFKGYCDRQGAPELAGSCVADPSDAAEEEVAKADKFGVIWASVQWRF